jgi:hypothetical protein
MAGPRRQKIFIELWKINFKIAKKYFGKIDRNRIGLAVVKTKLYVVNRLNLDWLSKIYNVTSSLVRFENKNVFICFEKCYTLLQLWHVHR